MSAARATIAGFYVLAAAARADEPPVTDVVRIESAPVIDGRLDDACWALAAPSDAFAQVEPGEGAVPTQRTEMRLLCDERNLYIGVRCFDTQAGSIIARQMRRDGDLSGDDRIAVMIDTFFDRRTGYLFELGARGGKRDGLVETSRPFRPDWDGIWYGRATVDSEGWTAEIAIPSTTVSFREGGTSWGLNVERVIRRHNEVVRWSGARQNSSISTVADAGTATGLDGLEQGIGLSMKPGIVARAEFETGDLDVEPTLDIFYRPTPSITAAITFNTDFAETEVDDRRVNLTRFPIFYPEKREFFTRDSQVFNFGGIRMSPLPFYSRRIGLGPGGEVEPILAGVKVTGREGPLSFGVLDVQMKEDPELGWKNLAVARARVDIFEESSVGAIMTHGDPATTGDNTLAGADLNLRTSNLPGDNVLEGSIWGMGTESTDAGNDGSAVGGRFSYPNDTVSFNFFAARIGEDFNPALGFVQRAGVYEYDAFGHYRFRPGGFVRTFDVGADYRLFTDLHSRLQSSALSLPTFTAESEDGDFTTLEFTHAAEQLDEPFEIVDGVTIPVGRYDFTRAFAEIETADSRAVSVGLAVEGGEFYDGHATGWTPAIAFNPGPGFRASLEYSHFDAELPEGSFIVRIVRARVEIQFSPSVSWDTVAQYDSESDDAGVNTRLRWEVEPGDDLFIVLNQGYTVDRDRWTSRSTELTIKAGVTFRF